MVTPQELQVVCRESNEIYGEKIVLCPTTEKKKFAFDKVWKKIVCLSWESKKSLITKKNHSPQVSNGPPLRPT